mgnify:CR=1 FL=1|jgi:hypothetical protein
MGNTKSKPQNENWDDSETRTHETRTHETREARDVTDYHPNSSTYGYDYAMYKPERHETMPTQEEEEENPGIL